MHFQWKKHLIRVFIWKIYKRLDNLIIEQSNRPKTKAKVLFLQSQADAGPSPAEQKKFSFCLGWVHEKRTPEAFHALNFLAQAGERKE